MPKSPGRVETLNIGMTVFPDPTLSKDSIIHCVQESGSKPVRSYRRGCHLLAAAACYGTGQSRTQPGMLLLPALGIFPKGWAYILLRSYWTPYFCFNFLFVWASEASKLLTSSLILILRMLLGLQSQRQLGPKWAFHPGVSVNLWWAQRR